MTGDESDAKERRGGVGVVRRQEAMMVDSGSEWGRCRRGRSETEVMYEQVTGRCELRKVDVSEGGGCEPEPGEC